MHTLYQAEWCPYSSRVRQRFTELGVSFAAVPVPAERADREEMRRKVGTDEIPALLLEDGNAITGDADALIQVRATDVAHLEAALERIRTNEAIARTKTIIVLSRLIARGEP